MRLLLESHTLVWSVGATRASRGRALQSPRLGLGTRKGSARLGTSWGLRTQATNCRHYAAVETPSSVTCVKAKCCRSGIPSLRLDLSGWKSLTNIKAPQF